MRILYLSNQRLPTEKAYGIQIAKTCEAMADLGCAITLLCPFRISKVKDEFFNYYGIKRNFVFKKVFVFDFYLPGIFNKIAFGAKSLCSALVLVLYALIEGADIFYTRDEPVAYILSFFRKNIVFESHRFSNKRKIFYSRFKKKNLKIIVISQGLKDDFINFGIKASNLLVARDGVDLGEFNINVSKEDARKRFFSNLHGEAFKRKKIAVYIGHLYSWKGVNIFSEIAKYVCDKNVNYLISFFGGTDKDFKILDEDSRVLQEELSKIHPNFVPILYPYRRVPHKDVPYILKAADGAILIGNESETISAKYTSPLKMFEYMASGCPIVAQALPSFREVLNDENSFLVKPGDAKALADKIAWIFDDANVKIAEEKASKAFDDVQKYTWQNRAANILNFLG
ncbi:MAG: glycosyltransferase [bacterium]|nr:glycosyltransferase [bacterium]